MRKERVNAIPVDRIVREEVSLAVLSRYGDKGLDVNGAKLRAVTRNPELKRQIVAKVDETSHRSKQRQRDSQYALHLGMIATHDRRQQGRPLSTEVKRGHGSSRSNIPNRKR